MNGGLHMQWKGLGIGTIYDEEGLSIIMIYVVRDVSDMTLKLPSIRMLILLEGLKGED